VEASGHVKTFVGDVQTGVGKVMDLFSKQSAAADDMATKVGSATKQASGAVDTEATNVTEATGTIEADNAKASTSFTTVATDAEAAHVKVGAAETTMVTEVTAADSTIEAENAAAKASFAGIGLGAAGIAAGGLAGMGDTTNLGSSGYQNAYNFLVQGGMSPAQAKAQLAKQGIRPPSGGGGAGGSSSVGAQGAPPILGSSVANQLLTMLQMEGLSKAGAAGIVGNAAQESNFNPNEPGGYLFQWLGSRLTGEQAFAASQGLPASNVSAQVGFVMKELQGMPGLLHMLQTTNNPQAAALAFSNIFERPNAALANNPHRESAAAQAYASPSAGGSVRTRGGRVISAPAYVNPLAHAQGVTQGRTDQGVDYTATPGSPIDALGSGKIVDIVKNWFKGQPLIEEQLTSGPDKGKFVYYAEQLHSLVKQGQSVKAGQQIARVAGSGTGLEIGYGAPGGRTLAQATTGYTEGQVTPAGQQFAALMNQIRTNKMPYAATPLGASMSFHGPSNPLLEVFGNTPKQMAADTKQGMTTLAHLLKDVHSGSMTALKSDLTKVHSQTLTDLERRLISDNNKTDRDLAQQLIEVHKKAMAELVKEEKTQAAENFLTG